MHDYELKKRYAVFGLELRMDKTGEYQVCDGDDYLTPDGSSDHSLEFWAEHILTLGTPAEYRARRRGPGPVFVSTVIGRR